MKIFDGRVRKKASLQLSINAIVVLILAITILGLGLGFIKKQFGGVESQFAAVSEEIKSGIIEKIRESGELLSFSQVDMEISRGKPKDFYVGIRNTQNTDQTFSLQWECSSAISGDCPSNIPEWFTTFPRLEIKPGEVGILPVTVLGQTTGKYLMKVVVNAGGAGACTSPPNLVRYQGSSKCCSVDQTMFDGYPESTKTTIFSGCSELAGGAGGEYTSKEFFLTVR